MEYADFQAQVQAEAEAQWQAEQEAYAAEQEAIIRQDAQREYDRLSDLIEHYTEIIQDLQQKRHEVLCDL